MESRSACASWSLDDDESLTPSGSHCTAQIIGRMLRNLKRLTVIVPDAVALQVTNVELAHVMDKASAQPLLTVEYLYCAGRECARFCTRTLNDRARVAGHLLTFYAHAACHSEHLG